MDTQGLYKLQFDSEDAGQWFLEAPRTPEGSRVDPRIFTYGTPVETPDPLTVPVRDPGHELDFSFAAFDMLVVTGRVGALIEHVAPGDIQRIPVRVEPATGSFEILNVLPVIDCIDRDRTVGTFWTPDDGRPEKVGQYRMIIDLKLDSARVGGHDIFRVGGWDIAVIVTERLKDALQREHVTGLTYRAVG